jgi:hypothetical protein
VRGQGKLGAREWGVCVEQGSFEEGMRSINGRRVTVQRRRHPFAICVEKPA